ncbi:MAG: BrnT family toxin [Selenomonadaceae bacterium]|nr:BrnT family toxin [Selenomonadaceae bacterium]
MENFEVGEYIVEWDDEKNQKNFKKHGVYFEDAARIFLDDNRIDEFDEIHSDFEDRYKIIGRVRDVLAVIYTEREEKFRIISARLASKKEEERYYGQYSYL